VISLPRDRRGRPLAATAGDAPKDTAARAALSQAEWAAEPEIRGQENAGMAEEPTGVLGINPDYAGADIAELERAV
jgi:hypothetical protein